jgi:hypothetical protein
MQIPSGLFSLATTRQLKFFQFFKKQFFINGCYRRFRTFRMEGGIESKKPFSTAGASALAGMN